jgi:hypothetical protein
MKVYLDKINIINYTGMVSNIGDESLGPKKVCHESWILTIDGKYKIIDNNYYKFKLQQKDTLVIDNYLSNSTAFCENSYFKKGEQVFNIPPAHQKITIKKYIYSRDPSISLIIEMINENVTDIYFWTKKDIEDPVIKQTIMSFVSNLT